MNIMYIKDTTQTCVLLILYQINFTEFTCLENKKLQNTSGFRYMCFE